MLKGRRQFCRKTPWDGLYHKPLVFPHAASRRDRLPKYPLWVNNHEMETIKTLTNNPAIFELSDIIETKMGKKILIGIMPPERREITVCSVIWDRSVDGFRLLYIPENLPSDVILCHELVHLILCIEGFPGLVMPASWRCLDPWYSDMVSYAFNTTLHLEVWPLGERLGFSESERFDDDIKNKLLPQIERGELFNYLPDDKRTVQAFYHLLAALLSPAPEATKKQLQGVSAQAMPMVFAHAQECCKACHSILPLRVETFFDISEMILAPLNVHQQGGILPDFRVSPTDPDFRKFVLQNYSYTCFQSYM